MGGVEVFKICPSCSTKWETRDLFLDDQSLKIIGYSADLLKLESSLFYFTHYKEGCSTTMAIQAKYFFDLYSGRQYSERKAGTVECPGFCLEKEQLSRCDAFCECAFNREIINMIKNNHKEPSRFTYRQ